MKRILVVNPNWLGDVVMTTPVFRTLKKNFPEAHIACLAVPRVRGILESCPDVDEIIDYDESGRHKGILGHWSLVRELRRRAFDTAFLLHRSRTRAFLVFLAGIPSRIGYDTKKLGILLTEKVSPLQGPVVHKADYYFHVLEAVGIEEDRRVTVLRHEPRALEAIERRLSAFGIRKSDKLVVFHVGANWEFKKWPAERFVQLARLIRGMDGVHVLISGGGKDRGAADLIQREVSGLHSLAGEITLKELIALLYRADVLVSADSGPMHIASSVGTNVVALFGPTRPEDSGPRGWGESVILREDVDCCQGECYAVDCPDHRCMMAITAAMVLEAVNGLLERSQKGPA